MAVNLNNINQGNNWGGSSPHINRVYSSIKFSQTIAGTADSGYLIPTFFREILPGQKISLDSELAIQFNPFVQNLFAELTGRTHAYFIPYRLLWKKWEEFITGGKDGLNNDVMPKAKLSHMNFKPLKHSLLDYLGYPLPANSRNETELSVLPIAAYNKIYNDYFRLLDLEEEDEAAFDADALRNFTVKITDGNEDISKEEFATQEAGYYFQLKKSNWNWDYFTKAKVFQQRGVTPIVPIDLSRVEGWLTGSKGEPTKGQMSPYRRLGQLRGASVNEQVTDMSQFFLESIDSDGYRDYTAESDKKWNKVTLKGAESANTGMNLQELYKSMALMSIQFNNAKIKPRYVDQLRARWGVTPEDYRLQMSEYLGSETVSITANTVTQTAPGGGDQTQQGNMTSQAWGTQRGRLASYEAKEHGILMVLMEIKPENLYERGAPAMWTHETRFDLPTPELQNMPDIPILDSELTGKPTKNNIGWRGIFDEYRTATNYVVGKLRPSAEGSLSSMTLARHYDEVKLNANYLKVDTKLMDRALQYPNEPDYTYFIRFNVGTALPLPLQPEPERLINL